MEEKPKNTIRKIIAVVMLFIVGAVFLYFGFQNEEDIVFSSVEDNAVHYKVFLKENNFFETPYLEEGGTYITSLIDRIDVNFHYQEALTKRTNGNISYYVRATISADKTEDSEVSYWSKDYLITEPSTLDFSDSEEISFDVSASVNYQEFNDILESFRKEYPVVSDGKIKIALIVDNTIYADEFSSPLASSSELNLSLPLLKRAIDAQINVNTGEKVHRFKTTVNKDGVIYPIMLIVGFGLIVTSLVIAVLMTVRMNKWKKQHLYITTRDKILNMNDSIITNVANMPSFKKLQQIRVSSFDELLDAYSELHLPINCYEPASKKESVFFIIGNDNVWVYRLKKCKIENDR